MGSSVTFWGLGITLIYWHGFGCVVPRYAHAAILEALSWRDKSGEGCAVDVSLFSAISDWLTVPLAHYESDGEGPTGIGKRVRAPQCFFFLGGGAGGTRVSK